MADEPAAPVAPGDDFVAEALAFVEGKAPVETAAETEEKPAADVAPGEAETEAEETPQPEEQPKDIWADAPEELRKQREAWDAERAAIAKERDTFRDKWNRERGRTSALTKKLSQAPAQPAPDDSDPIQKLDKAFADLSQDFPDLGEKLAPLGEVMRSLRGELEPIKAQQQAIGERAEEDAEEAQVKILTDRVPDWLPTLQKSGKAFWDWVDQQEAWVQELAARNRESMVDGGAAAFVIERFKSDTAPPPEHPNPTPDRRRERQLSGAAAPKPSHRTTVSDPPPTTEAGLVNEALKYVEKAFPTR